MDDTQKSLLTNTALCFCGPLSRVWDAQGEITLGIFVYLEPIPRKSVPKSCKHLLKKEKARIAVSFKTHDSGDASTQVLYDILLPKALSQEMAILSDLNGFKQVQGSHQEIRI